MPRQAERNTTTIVRLMPTPTSEISKKLQPEAADQVQHRVQQRDLLPERRQHADRIEAAAEKRERGHDQQRDELQLLEVVGPDTDDEPEKAEGHGGQHQESKHPAGCAIRSGTSSAAVPMMISPMTTDLVAAAPTYPITASQGETGADSNS